ncbi:uncharacterized protein [Musca autumnalis]|uniref:uncharacterized protein n=1 Tax=Musca autumnalis TaxID=221902 RepID=UPI003CF3B854
MPLTPLDLFNRAADALVKFDAYFSSQRDDELDVYILELLGAEARTLWEKVKLQSDICLNYLYEDKNSNKDNLVAADIKFDVAYKCFMNVLSSINRKLGVLRTSSQSPTFTSPKSHIDKPTVPRSEDTTTISDVSHRLTPSNNTSFTSCGDVNAGHRLNLPPCDIEVFNGDFLSWPTFRDLFSALYINNSGISDIERLCHLKKKTSGDAHEIVAKFSLTHTNFSLAWNALQQTYDNPRILVNHQLKRLFDLPVLEEETCLGLKSLQRGINGCISSMSNYDVPTDDWDPILVFLCLQRLPKHCVVLWEQCIKNKSALSSWADLDQFLTERIQTLTCLRDIRGIDYVEPLNHNKRLSHSTNGGSIKTSVATPQSTPRSSRYSRAPSPKSCALCSRQRHHLRVCQKFLRFSVPERISAVKKHYCCLNCLSHGHKASHCNSVHNCTICNKRHHTLLHREVSPHRTSPTSPDSRSLVALNSPSTSTGHPSGSNSRQVFHTTQNREILLGTAMVHIVHQGTTYPARALIDPASESSFISENMQSRIGIATNAVKASILGVSRSVSVISDKECSIHIVSPLDATHSMDTTALVVPTVADNLPSCAIPTDTLPQLPNLRLADPDPFFSHSVDLLLGADLYPKILAQGSHTKILGSLIAQSTVFGWILTGPMPSTHTGPSI